jgi:3-oxoacyl-[acyl-carrier-protein] synthase-3
MKYSKIISVGSYLPKNCVKNSDLPAHLETSDEWIISRTGITQRYIAADDELTSDLATAAAKAALKNAGLTEVDAIIVATTTPDNTFPATAVAVQHKLGIRTGFAFDVQAVCSGFVYALSIADSFIKSGQIKSALVIGAETLTRTLDWNDRGTCVLFGDGAGAVVLTASDTPGIISTQLHSDGAYYDQLYVDGGVSRKSVGVLKMHGKEVFKHAVAKMSESILSILKDNNYSMSDVSWIVPHQANLRIMDAIAERIGVDKEKVIATVVKHANTSAATIPLGLDDSWSKFKKGDLIALTALGGGFTWGSVLLKF